MGITPVVRPDRSDERSFVGRVGISVRPERSDDISSVIVGV